MPFTPRDPDTLKLLIAREVEGLRSAARRNAGVRTAEPAEAPGTAAGACVCGGGGDRAHSCGAAAGEEHDPWACLCATLPAIPVSAALLVPVREDGTGGRSGRPRRRGRRRARRWRRRRACPASAPGSS
ncbi:hypothetical protein AB0D15_37945, partial [Streptomyces sp. NPDC048551]